MSDRSIITPNQVELQRLWKRFFPDEPFSWPSPQDEYSEFLQIKGQFGPLKSDHPMASMISKISKLLNNTLIFRKGLIDVLSNGDETYFVGIEGSAKRCGGIGDILSGTLGTFMNY